MGRLLAQEKGSNWGLLGSERVYLAINPIGAAPSLYTKIDRKGGGGGRERCLSFNCPLLWLLGGETFFLHIQDLLVT